MAVTPAQMLALQAYVAATVRVMTVDGGRLAHSDNVRLFMDATRKLEGAFGIKVPTALSTVSLNDAPPAPKPNLVNIL
jgi:hypothetical protein